MKNTDVEKMCKRTKNLTTNIKITPAVYVPGWTNDIYTGRSRIIYVKLKTQRIINIMYIISKVRWCSKHHCMRNNWFLKESISSSFVTINRKCAILFSCIIEAIFFKEYRTDQFKFTIIHRPELIGFHKRVLMDF